MKKIAKFIPILLIVLMLVSCVSIPQRQALSLQNRANIKSDQVLLNTTEREIAMRHNNWLDANFKDPYAPMDSGAIVHHNAGYNPPNASLLADLVIAGIKHHEASSAQASLASVRSALGDFDYVKFLTEELKPKLAKLSWLKVRKFDVRYNIHATENGIVNRSKEDTTLFIGTTYALDSDYRQLQVVAYVKLAKKQSDKDTIKTLYANNFYFIYRLRKPSFYSSMNKKVWANDKARFLKSKLQDAAYQISSMIAMDIRNPSKNPYAKLRQKIKIRDIDGAMAYGRLVEKSNDYYRVALVTAGNMNGYLYAVNKADVLE